MQGRLDQAQVSLSNMASEKHADGTYTVSLEFSTNGQEKPLPENVTLRLDLDRGDLPGVSGSMGGAARRLSKSSQSITLKSHDYYSFGLIIHGALEPATLTITGENFKVPAKIPIP
jgi:hypothetical protein